MSCDERRATTSPSFSVRLPPPPPSSVWRGGFVAGHDVEQHRCRAHGRTRRHRARRERADYRQRHQKTARNKKQPGQTHSLTSPRPATRLESSGTNPKLDPNSDQDPSKAEPGDPSEGWKNGIVYSSQRLACQRADSEGTRPSRPLPLLTVAETESERETCSGEDIYASRCADSSSRVAFN